MEADPPEEAERITHPAARVVLGPARRRAEGGGRRAEAEADPPAAGGEGDPPAPRAVLGPGGVGGGGADPPAGQGIIGSWLPGAAASGDVMTRVSEPWVSGLGADIFKVVTVE